MGRLRSVRDLLLSQWVESWNGVAALAIQQEDWPLARESRTESLHLLTSIYGETHPKVTDARLERSFVDTLAALTAEQRRRLAMADGLHTAAVNLPDNKSDQQISDLEQVIAIRKDVLGEAHVENLPALTAPSGHILPPCHPGEGGEPVPAVLGDLPTIQRQNAS